MELPVMRKINFSSYPLCVVSAGKRKSFLVTDISSFFLICYKGTNGHKFFILVNPGALVSPVVLFLKELRRALFSVKTEVLQRPLLRQRDIAGRKIK